MERVSERETSGDAGGPVAMMAAVEQVEVVLANNDRVTLRVGDVFLKIDADQARTDVAAVDVLRR